MVHFDIKIIVRASERVIHASLNFATMRRPKFGYRDYQWVTREDHSSRLPPGWSGIAVTALAIGLQEGIESLLL
jgi:hypothetical protein